MRFSNQLRPVATATVLAAAFYLLAVLVGDSRQIGHALASLTWPQLVMILGLSLFNYALRFLRWHYYVATLGHTIAWRRHLAYYLAGFAFTITPGKAGEAIRSLYLKAHGMSYTESLASFFVERLLDILAIALLAIGGAWFFPNYRLTVWLACLALGVLTWLIAHPKFLLYGLYWTASRITATKLTYSIEKITGLLKASAHLLTPGKLYAGLLIGILAWAAEGFALYLIAKFMGISLTVVIAMSIYAVSTLIGALSFLPGGLGGTEAVMGLLLALAGANSSAAIAVTLLCRLTTLWFAVLIGSTTILGLQLHKA